MKRRDFLKTTLAAAGGAALAGLPSAKAEVAGEAAQDVPKVSAMKAGGWDTPNRAPLRPTPFSKLPQYDFKTPQYDFKTPQVVSSAKVCWFDNTESKPAPTAPAGAV